MLFQLHIATSIILQHDQEYNSIDDDNSSEDGEANETTDKSYLIIDIDEAEGIVEGVYFSYNRIIVKTFVLHHYEHDKRGQYNSSITLSA